MGKKHKRRNPRTVQKQQAEKKAPEQREEAPVPEEPAVPNESAPSAPEQSAARERTRSPMTPVQRFLLNALIVLTVLWLLFGFVFGFAAMPNGDMAPHIKSSDLLLYYRLDREHQAQDVAVLRKNGTTYVGRIIAVGGDTVDITDSDQLILNGNAVQETGISASTPRFEGFVEYPVTLQAGEYFVLADARGGAEDSRYYGIVSEKELLGTVITLIRRHGL